MVGWKSCYENSWMKKKWLLCFCFFCFYDVEAFLSMVWCVFFFFVKLDDPKEIVDCPLPKKKQKTQLRATIVRRLPRPMMPLPILRPCVVPKSWTTWRQTSRVSPSDIQGFTTTWKGVGDMLLDELMRYIVVFVPLLYLGLHTLLGNQYFRWESLFVQNNSVSGDWFVLDWDVVKQTVFEKGKSDAIWPRDSM